MWVSLRAPLKVRMRYLIELNNFESPSEKLAREKAEAEARGSSVSLGVEGFRVWGLRAYRV